MIPTLFGFAVVLVLVLFATQVIFDLYARSAVTSATVEAARSVAGYANSATYGTGAPDPAERAAMEQAQMRAVAALGSYGHMTSFDWTGTTGRKVVLRVGFDLGHGAYDLSRPLYLPGLNRFSRIVELRVERVACQPGGRCASVLSPGGGPPSLGGMGAVAGEGS